MAAQADADPDASDGADRSVLATAALANQWEAVPWVAVVVNSSYQTGVSSPNKNGDAFLLGNYGTPVGMEKGQCFFTFRFRGRVLFGSAIRFWATFSSRFFGSDFKEMIHMFFWNAFHAGFLGFYGG